MITVPTLNASEAPPAPLLETYTRLRAVNPYLQVHCGRFESCGGVPFAALTAADNATLGERLAIMGREYNTTHADVMARFFFRGFAYYLASATVGPFALERRVPVFTPDALGVTLGSWGAEAIVIRDSSFYCLPTDAEVRHPEAIPVPDLDALRTTLREAIEAVCAPLIAALRPRARVGARTMWIMAAESCAGALADALPAETSEDEARAEVAALIGEPASLLRAKPEVLALTADGQRGLVLLGDDCCCNFRLDGEDYCDNCPHQPREVRIAALRQWIATRSTAEATA